MVLSNTYKKEQKSMKELLIEIMKSISDSGNPIASKVITYFGVAGGVGGGTVQVVTSNSSLASNEFVQDCANVAPDWLVYVPAVGVVSLILKHIADVYFRRKELKILERKKPVSHTSGQD